MQVANTAAHSNLRHVSLVFFPFAAAAVSHFHSLRFADALKPRKKIKVACTQRAVKQTNTWQIRCFV